MNYELVYILTPKLSDDDAEKKAKAFNQKIKEEVNEIVLEDFWGKKELAYPINKLEHGYYMLVQFKAEKESIKKIEKLIKLDDEFIRHLLVKKDEFASIRKEEEDKKESSEIIKEPELEKEEKAKEEITKEDTVAQTQEKSGEEEVEEKIDTKEEMPEKSEESTDEVEPKKEKKKAKADISDLDKKLEDILDSGIDD